MTGDPTVRRRCPAIRRPTTPPGWRRRSACWPRSSRAAAGRSSVAARCVMSQLNYRASAWLNDGIEPQRHPNGRMLRSRTAVPDGRRLSRPVHHPRRVLAPVLRRGRVSGFPTMAERAAQREEVLAVVTAALAADTAKSWEARLRPLGIPAAAVRSARRPRGDPGGRRDGGDFRLVGSPFTSQATSPSTDRRRLLDEHAQSYSTVTDSVSGTLTGEDVPLGHFILIQRVVDAHGRLALDELGHAGAAVARLAAERRRQPARRRSPAGSRSRRARTEAFCRSSRIVTVPSTVI